MSIEDSCVEFNLSECLSDQNKINSAQWFSKALQYIEMLSSKKAKVTVKQLGSVLCFICNNQITKNEYRLAQTSKLNCNCNNHMHNACLKKQIMEHKELLNGISAIVDILNAVNQCQNCPGSGLVDASIISLVISQKEIDNMSFDFQENQKQREMEEQKQGRQEDREDEEQKKQDEEEFTCGMCLCEYTLNDGGYKLSCGCKFSLDCLNMCFKDQVKNNKDIQLDKITCPEETCKKQITFDDICTILKDDKDIIDKLEQMSIRTLYEAMKKDNPNSLEQLVVCPGKFITDNEKTQKIYISQETLDKERQGKEKIPVKDDQRIEDCEFTFILDRSIKKQSHKCQKCKYQFCLNNCDGLHENFSCSDYQKWKLEQNKDYRAELESQGFKFCPNCNILSFKITGCNKIECTNCKMFYCHTCYFLAKTAGEVYSHLTAVHGGYY